MKANQVCRKRKDHKSLTTFIFCLEGQRKPTGARSERTKEKKTKKKGVGKIATTKRIVGKGRKGKGKGYGLGNCSKVNEKKKCGSQLTWGKTRRRRKKGKPKKSVRGKTLSSTQTF